MMREIVFLVSSFLVCWKGVYPFLDIDELKNIHYDIDIVNQPVLFGRPSEQDVVYMTSKYGQQYECQLPDLAELEIEMDEERAASEMGISELLKPMETAPCLKKTKDWWSYVFCYGNKIEQFHLENDKIIGDVVVLGIYQSQTDWSDNATANSRKNRLNRYHSHNYINGSTCDLNGKPRQAEVRFHCAEGEGDSISRIDEPTTCSYIVTIHTTRICHHPYLKLPPKIKPKSVLCSPALTQDQFDIYSHYEEQAQIEKKKKEEEAATKAAEIKAAWFEQLLGITKKPTAAEDLEEQKPDETEDDVVDGKETVYSEELQDILEKYDPTLSVDGIEDAIALGIDPKTLAKVLEDVMDSVQDSMETIDKEVNTAPENDIDGSESNKPVSETDDEDDQYKDGDYKSLLRDFREGIDDMGVTEEEAKRLLALVDELEISFNNIEAVEKMLGAIQDRDGSQEQEGGVAGEDGEESTGTLEDGEIDEADDEDGEDEEAEQLLVSKINELIKKLKRDHRATTKDAKSDKGAVEDNSDDRVKVRVTRIKVNKATGENDQEKVVSLYDPDHKSLEEAIQEHLEQSGIQVEGGKIELKVLTYKPDDWPDDGEDDSNIAILSEDEATYFKNIVTGFLGSKGQAEEVKHHKLEENYRFHWEKDNHRISEEPEQEDSDSSPNSFL